MLRSIGICVVGLASWGILSTTTATAQQGGTTTDELELVQVQVICRHGARTPFSSSKRTYINDLEWDCEDVMVPNPNFFINYEGQKISYDIFKLSEFAGQPKMYGNCVGGQLTKVGMNQMAQLGKTLRELYVDKFKLLEQKFTPKSFYIRSSNTSRTVLTAREIMNGLYPPSTRSASDIVEINILKNANENLYPRSKCSKFIFLKKSFHKSPVIAELDESTKQTMSNATEKEKLTSRHMSGLANQLNSLVDHSFPLPPGMSTEDYNSVLKLSGAYNSSFYTLNDEAKRIGIGRFIGDLTAAIRERTTKESKKQLPKLLLYSGHDNTLVPLLNALQVSDGYHPRMGVALILELWKNPKNEDYFFQIRKFEQQQPLKTLLMQPCTSTMCPLPQFFKKVERLIPDDYEKECSVKT